MTIPGDYSSFDFADANAKNADPEYKIQDVWTSLSYYGIEKIYNDISVASTARTRMASKATATTTIQITAGKKFKLENETGEWLKFDGVNYTGTMTVYECYSSGLDKTMVWNITVDNSPSYKLSETSVGCELICTVGEQGYAIQADGADSITLSSERMKIEGTNYTLSGAVQTKSCDLIQLSADVEGNACITCDDEIKMEFEGQGENVSVVTCDDFETNAQKIDGALDKVVVDDSGEIKDIESSDGKNEKDIGEISISEITSQVYTGKAITPSITVKDDSTTLVQDTDYTLTYENNVNAGTATVIITGAGKYTGKVTKTFLIKKAGNTITASDLVKKASAKEQTFDISAKAKGGNLTYKSNNSKISLSNTGKVTIAANYVGTATITVTAGDDNYETVTKSIKITVNKVPNTITASDFTKTYSTKKQTFSVDAKRKGKGKLTYSSNNAKVKVNSAGKVTINAKFIGKATITIKVAANGIYKAATKKITVTVNPTKTSISKVTNTKGKKLTISWKKNTVATGYQIQYSTSKTFSSGNKTVNITKNSTTSKTITGLTKGKKYYVRIRTCKSVSGKKYYSEWSTVKYKISYVLNGGTNSSSNPASYTITTATITLKNPSRTGYTFGGWYTKSNFSGSKATKVAKGSTGNKTFYAKWTANKYTIKFNGNGSTAGAMTAMTNRSYGTSYTLTANKFEKSGYVFAGWNTKADGSGKTYEDKTSVKNLSSKSGGSVTLYASWKAVPTSISLSETEISLEAGATYQLAPVITPAELAESVIEYSVKDETVAMVSADGLITAVAEGETIVQCQSKDNPQVQIEVNVIVKTPEDSGSIEEPGTSGDTGSTEGTDTSGDTGSTEGTDTSGDTGNTEGTGTSGDTGSTEGTDTSGEQEEPDDTDWIQISTAEELTAISSDLSGNYELTADIDLSGSEWTPIGTSSEPFTGTLKGNDHTISGMSITNGEQIYTGLFAYLKGSVKNLTVEGSIELKECSGNRTLYAGGIAGQSDGAQIVNCTSNVSITVENTNTEQGTYIFAGGITGESTNSTEITNCQNDNAISVTAYNGTRVSTYAGGIAGECSNSSKISGSTNNGKIAAYASSSYSTYWVSSYAGGIAGNVGVASVVDSVNNNSVIATAYPLVETTYSSSAEAGGIAGHLTTGTVSGESTVEDIQAIVNEFATAYTALVTGRTIN